MNTPDQESAPHIINFSVPPIKAEVLVHALEEKEIYVSTTSACSSKQKKVSNTLTAMGIPSATCKQCNSVKPLLFQFNGRSKKCS